MQRKWHAPISLMGAGYFFGTGSLTFLVRSGHARLTWSARPASPSSDGLRSGRYEPSRRSVDLQVAAVAETTIDALGFVLLDGVYKVV